MSEPLAERTGSFDPGVATIIRNTHAVQHELGELSGKAGMLIEHSQRVWASRRFSGTRHRLHYLFEGTEAVDQGEFLIMALPDHDFTIPGQKVTDACVTECDQRFGPNPRLAVTLELLLLDEG